MEEDKYIEVDSKTIILHTDPPELPRLTPTGKISYAKTRVYTQRYRKEWEQTSDFKGINIYIFFLTIYHFLIIKHTFILYLLFNC